MGEGRERGRGSQKKLGSAGEGGQVCLWTRSPRSSRIFEGLGAVCTEGRGWKISHPRV